MRLLRLSVCVGIALTPVLATAQRPVAPDSSTHRLAPANDSSSGALSGRAAAGQRGIVGQFALGFAAGVPAGPMIVSGIGSPAYLVGGTLVLLGANAVSARGGLDPPTLAPDLSAQSAEYRSAFLETYRRELAHRRQRAVRIGMLTGAVASIATLGYFIFSSWDE